MSPSHKWLGYFQVQRSHAGNGKRGRNLDGGFLPNAAAPKRTGRVLRNSQFEIVRASFPVFILGWTIRTNRVKIH